MKHLGSYSIYFVLCLLLSSCSKVQFTGSESPALSKAEVSESPAPVILDPLPAPAPSPQPDLPQAPENPPPAPAPVPTPAPVPAPAPLPAPTPVSTSEDFVQTARQGKVDLLVISDNSDSMEEDQTEMYKRLSGALGGLHGLDIQVGITTPDISVESPYNTRGGILPLTGSSLKILTPATPNADELFRRSVQRQETIGCYYRKEGPWCGSNDEQPIRASMMAIDQRDGLNRGFFRDDADLEIMVISDEDELSDGGVSATTPDALLSHFAQAFGSSKRLTVNGIINIPGDSKCRQQQRGDRLFGNAGEYGSFVYDLATRTDGRVTSICSSNYASAFHHVGVNSRKLNTRIDLKHEPLADSVFVVVSPPQNVTYEVQGQTLVFTQPPSEGSQIHVGYKYKN